jgi:hypothetical protein
MEEVLQSTLKTKGLLSGGAFQGLAVRIPETITLLDLPTLYFKNKCSALGIRNDEVGLGITESSCANSDRVPGVPPLGKLFRECLIDRSLSMGLGSSWHDRWP